ncbi:MAG TPA: DUF2330 domain-containing protein [Herpetosiphonaceae bacterium]
MRRFWSALCGALLCLLLSAQVAAACGGLFTADAPVSQSAERFILAVDEQAGTVSAILQLSYSGSAESFSWLLPVPSEPDLAVADEAAFAELDRLTKPEFKFPGPPECFNPRDGGGVGAGAPGGVNVVQQGQVGPYETAVIGGENPAEVAEWLRTNGYQVTPAIEPKLKLYTDQKMLFVAMRLRGDQTAQDIQPIRVTFKADKLVIPMQLSSVSATPDMALNIWIFGPAQARPENLSGLRVNKNDLAVINLAGGNNYQDVRAKAIDNAPGGSGRGLVIEYAKPTSGLAATDPLLAELAGSYPYLTRFYGEMSPGEMTVDPTFVFDRSQPDVEPVIDMTNRVTPYDCETNELQTVRRQQNDAARGPGRKSPEEATKDLRRGPLQLVSLVVVLGIGLLIFWLARKPRRSGQA